jgi:HPt (histidine-containing phosphotransfer) domain-containing protein
MEHVFFRLIREFVSDYGNASEKLTDMITGGYYEDAIRFVHSMKGAAANLSVTDLRDSAEEMENLLKSGEVGQTQGHLSSLAQKLSRMKKEVGQLFLDGQYDDNTDPDSADGPFLPHSTPRHHALKMTSLTERLKELDSLLALSDIDAEELWLEIKNDIKILDDNTLDKLDNAIENMEFEKARKILATIIEEYMTAK